MKEPAPTLEDAEQLLVERTGIEFAGEAKDGRVVDNAVKISVREGGYDLKGITHNLCDFGIIKQLLRPGIEPGNLLCPRVKLDGYDVLRCAGCFNGGVAKAGGSVEDVADDGGDRGNFLQGILQRVYIYDAVHGEARDQHAWCAARWQETTDAIGILGEDLDSFYAFALDNEAVRVRFIDLLNILPTQPFAAREKDALGGEGHSDSRSA